MNKVCAVVVTFNRINLLEECLNKLLNQSVPLDILVVDNASTDGTQEFIKKEYPSLGLIELSENVGGAGGFYEGLKKAYEMGYEWVWILDDDTMAEPNTLEELLEAYDAFTSQMKPTILASKVVWNDGTVHPMNISNLKDDYELSMLAAEKLTLSIRSSSFVSMLVNRAMIEKYGLPHKKFFIWNDDFEYSARVLKNEFGVLVPKSIVTHKTKIKYSPLESSGERYYYEVRNKYWVLKTDSLEKKEKIITFFRMNRGILKYLKLNKFKAKSLKIVIKGTLDGITKSFN